MPLDLATTNRKTAIMYAGEVPWHGLEPSLMNRPRTNRQSEWPGWISG